MKNFDVNGVIMEFLEGRVESRADLMREIMDAMGQRNRATTTLTAAIAHHAASAPLATPETVVKTGIIYGMVLGILLEREYMSRQKVQ